MAQPITSPAPADTVRAPQSWRATFDRETLAHRWDLAWVLVQVVLIGLLIRAFTIESPTFVNQVIPLVLGGSVVSHFLPKAHRLWFFGALSIAGIGLVFGPLDGALMVGVGLGLMALCHLRISYWARVALVLAAGGLFAAQRAGLVPSFWSMAVWPIFGSMFMFRLIIYLYDIRHIKQPTTWPERIAYFFCLPNVAFPLFPVIDFSTFRRTYFDRPAHEIYQQGIGWMVRGLTHLVLYRFVYQYATIDPAAVDSGAKLVQYMVATCALYLRVSGQFHLIVGILHLFGFRLPETHKFFFLASSFSDYWKRINIYWKDFMQKVVYMPLFFRAKRWRGDTFALVLTSLLVFFTTWVLHSYQWFWVLGIWLLSRTDAAYWGILAVCLVANQLWELRHVRVRSLGAPVLSPARLALHGARTAVMFGVLCLMWTLWNAPTPRDFVALFASATFGLRDGGVVLALLVAVAVVAVLGYRRAHAPTVRQRVRRFDSSTVGGFVFLLAIVAGATTPAAKVLPGEAYAVAVNVREGLLNTADQVALRRGYYEQVQDVSRFNPELWRLYGGSSTPPRVGPRQAGVVESVNDARIEVVRPNLDLEFVGARVQTNQWGMRDQQYTLAKPAGTWRVALFGASYVFGSGVANGETFESLVEDRLNRELAAQQSVPTRYEILNFAMPGSSPWQYLATLKTGDVERFAPDVVLIVGNRNEFWNVARYWQEVMLLGAEPPVPHLIGLLRSTGFNAKVSRDSATKLLLPVRDSMLVVLYAALANEIRRMGAVPVYGPIEMPLERRAGSISDLMQLAEGAGFVTFDLTDVYHGHNEHELILNDFDRHPNVEGHRVIAEGLYAELLKRPALIGGETSASAPTAR